MGALHVASLQKLFLSLSVHAGLASRCVKFHKPTGSSAGDTCDFPLEVHRQADICRVETHTLNGENF